MAKIRIKKIKVEDIEIELPVYFKKLNNKGEVWRLIKIVADKKSIELSDVQKSARIVKGDTSDYFNNKNLVDATQEEFEELYSTLSKKLDRLSIEAETTENEE